MTYRHGASCVHIPQYLLCASRLVLVLVFVVPRHAAPRMPSPAKTRARLQQPGVRASPRSRSRLCATAHAGSSTPSASAVRRAQAQAGHGCAAQGSVLAQRAACGAPRVFSTRTAPRPTPGASRAFLSHAGVATVALVRPPEVASTDRSPSDASRPHVEPARAARLQLCLFGDSS